MKFKFIQSIFMVIGLLLIAYPIMSDLISSYNQTVVISDYQEQIKKMSEVDKKQKLDLAQKYNEELENETVIDLSLNDTKVDRKLYESYLNALNVGDAIAYINIPKINVYLPIYNSVSNDVLQSGVGHIDNTSLPVGGKNTHCVLAGHTGLATKKIFDDIDKLEIGDKFYLYVLDQILEYEVDNIKVVKPDDTDAIEFNKEKDFVTLVTCTPYLVNSHRLLVRGTRVINHQNDNSQNITDEDNSNNLENLNNLNNLENDNSINVNDTINNIQKLKFKNLVKVLISFIILIIIIIISIKYILKRKD